MIDQDKVIKKIDDFIDIYVDKLIKVEKIKYFSKRYGIGIWIVIADLSRLNAAASLCDLFQIRFMITGKKTQDECVKADCFQVRADKSVCCEFHRGEEKRDLIYIRPKEDK
jgi:hypothetical protein